MSSVPQLSEMQFDRSGNKHLVCTEYGAIDLVIEKLKSLDYLPKNLKILQFKNKENIAIYLDIEQFDSMNALKSRVIEMLNFASIGMRFYAIGSEQFVWSLWGCARSFGLSAKEINLEAIDSKSKNIYCSNCQIINHLVTDNNPTCFNCDIKLEVLEHFSRPKNAYLGICTAEN